MIIRGSLYVTTDLNLARSAVYSGCRLVAITENTSMFAPQDLPNIALASILLPPAQASMAEMDGNMEVFYGMYMNHLMTKEADAFICLIIAALVRGINVLLYVPKDEAQMAFLPALIQHLLVSYGITVGTEQNQFGYNSQFDAMLCTRLYMHEFISYQEFFTAYPAYAPIDPISIPQLIIEMNPAVLDCSEAGYYKYFNDYKDRIKFNNNVFLENPLVKG